MGLDEEARSVMNGRRNLRRLFASDAEVLSDSPLPLEDAGFLAPVEALMACDSDGYTTRDLQH